MDRGLAISLVLLLSIPVNVYPATYYVKTDGDDGLDGLSLETAWQHIERGCTTVVAGDTLFIDARGGRYTGSGNVGVLVTHSGTPTDPIVIKGYGGIPILDGEHRNDLGGDWWYKIIGCSDQSWIVFDSLDARNHQDWTNPETEAGCFLANQSDHIVFKNCRACSSMASTTNLSGGFMLRHARYCVVKNCEVWDHYNENMQGNAAGINIYHSDGNHPVGNLVDSCTVYDCVFGIQIKSTECDRNRVQYCTIHDVTSGIVCQADSCTIRFNVIYDCVYFGIGCLQGYGPTYWDSVYNNTVVNTGGFDLYMSNLYGTNDADTFTIFNNICVSHNGGGAEKENYIVRHTAPAPSCWKSDYNLFYDNTYSGREVVYGSGMSLSSWQNLCMEMSQCYDDFCCETHSIGQNPLFVDEANHDYRLAPDSPCIGAGKDGTDMGALPYGSGRNLGTRSGIDKGIRSHKEEEVDDDHVEQLIGWYFRGE